MRRQVSARNRPSDDEGATAIEYALIASLIAVVISGAVTLVGTAVVGMFAGVPAGL